METNVPRLRYVLALSTLLLGSRAIPVNATRLPPSKPQGISSPTVSHESFPSDPLGRAEDSPRRIVAGDIMARRAAHAAAERQIERLHRLMDLGEAMTSDFVECNVKWYRYSADVLQDTGVPEPEQRAALESYVSRTHDMRTRLRARYSSCSDAPAMPRILGYIDQQVAIAAAERQLAEAALRLKKIREQADRS